MTDTVFGQMIRGEIEVDKVHEDEDCIVIRDMHPQAPLHLLVIPKKSIACLADAQSEDAALLGRLLLVAKQQAERAGCGDAFRLFINNGEGGGQTVFHLHLHVIGDKPLSEAAMANQTP